jgi:hypothetical protein
MCNVFHKHVTPSRLAPSILTNSDAKYRDRNAIYVRDYYDDKILSKINHLFTISVNDLNNVAKIIIQQPNNRRTLFGLYSLH